MMNSNIRFSKTSVVSKTSATSAIALALALFCGRSYIPEIAQKLRTGKVERPAWEPDSALPEPVFPTKGVERVSPRSSCNEVGYALDVTTSGGIGAGGLPMHQDCFETSNKHLGIHSKQGDREFARELMEKHRAREQKTSRPIDKPMTETTQYHAKEEEADLARKELLALASQRHDVTSTRRRFKQARLPEGGMFAALVAPLILFGALVLYTDVQEVTNELDETEADSGQLKETLAEKEEVQNKTPVTLEADIAAQDPLQFVECFALEEDELPQSAELADSYDADWSCLESKPRIASYALWPCTPSHLRGSMHAAMVVVVVVMLASLASQLRRAAGTQSEQVVQTIDNELIALAVMRQGTQLPDGVTAFILSILAALSGVAFSFDVQDALEEEATKPCADMPPKEVTKDVGDEQCQAQSPALWPCTLFQLRGFMRSAIVVISVLSVAIVTSQVRRALASQGEQLKMEVETAEEELMAMSAKHQASQLPNGVTALILSIFATLGGVVFSFDVQDALEDEASESRADEPSKQVAKDEGDEQKPEVQSPALWPCTLFSMRGFIHSAIVVSCVVVLAVVTSQLRAALASQGEQLKMEVLTIDEELMALSAKHQGSHLPNSATVLILSIFALLGGVVFSFDVQDEDEASESCADEPSKEVAKDEGDEQKPEVQSPALWPCTLFHTQGFMHSAIVVCGVVGLAVVTSQLRVAMASQGEQLKMEVLTIDEELTALSGKHQGSHLPNSATVLILSIFALLGGVVFSFDVQDVDEASESRADEPSKAVAKDEGDEQKPEVQSPALWPCTLFHMQGFMHSAIVVCVVLGLAVVTSQLRAAMASQGEQMKVEVLTIDEELMALSAKHQGSQLSNSATVLILSIFALLGGVVFSFDVQDVDEASESCADEPSKEVAKDEGDEQKPEVQSPALWPCTLFQLRGFIHSAIVVGGVVGLAVVSSQLRSAFASQGEHFKMEVQTADDELLALSAKHLGSPLLNGLILLTLGTFALFGGLVFSFDVKDLVEEDKQ